MLTPTGIIPVGVLFFFSMSLLSIKQITKTFGAVQVLKGIDLSVEKGECLALLGPNGAGKSTTIQIALGLLHSDSGEVFAVDHNMRTSAHLARQHIGVVPQYDGLDPDFTVRENLEVFAGYFGISRVAATSRFASLLEFASLSHRANDSVVNLSGGMRRRLSLARALVNQPKLLFLDEPTTALDPQAKHLIWDRLVQLKNDGIGIFLTTHFMDEAQRLADKVAVLDAGKIIAFDRPSQLISQYVGEYVLEIWGKENLKADISALLEGEVTLDVRSKSIYVYGPAVRLIFDKLVALEKKAMPPFDSTFKLKGGGLSDGNGLVGNGIKYLFRPTNLEDVFFSLTGRDLSDG